MTGLKTNERPGTRAVLRHCHMSATKARQVLDLVRSQDVDRAAEILSSTPREAATVVGKVLASAVANAVHNDEEEAEDLYVSACYADESATLKRWRPRARGRASRIRKRTCHITVIVSRMDTERLARRREERQAAGAQRQRRVAASRRRADLAGRLSRRRHAAEAEAALGVEAPEVEIEEREPDAEEAVTEVEGGEVEGGEVEGGEAEGGEAEGGEAEGGEAEGGEAEDVEGVATGAADDTAGGGLGPHASEEPGVGAPGGPNDTAAEQSEKGE